MVLVISVILSRCEKQRINDFKKAQVAQNNGEIRIASSLFEKIIQKEGTNDLSIQSTRELVKIYLYELKDYNKAIEKLRFLVLYSKDAAERIKSQKQIAQIFFDNKAQYENAVVEFSRLLSVTLTKVENIEIRLSIARAYYHLGNFEQSWQETLALSMITDIPEGNLYDIKLLQANIKMAQKDHSTAAKMYEELLKLYQVRANKENIPLSLSLCYEVEGEFEKAIEILTPLVDSYKPSEFISLKIKKLIDRQLNKPKKRVKK
jgi:tetratricopeptide (TPR) repeat protein